MNVFISWSGRRSKELAEVLSRWLPTVIQAVKPYYTPDDIEKGTRWDDEIAKHLAECSIGIICLTPENLEAPWIMFESGALSKHIRKSRVCPLLFGVDPTEVKGPLVRFQAARFNKGEMNRVLQMINNELGENAVDKDVLNEVFGMMWPRLEPAVRNILDRPVSGTTTSERSERDILEEILALTRSAAQNPILSRSLADSRKAGMELINPNQWPELLRSSMELVSTIEKEIVAIAVSNEDLAEKLRQKTRSIGLEHNKELQVSILDKNRTFLYHDWEFMIGSSAYHAGRNGRDIYNEIYNSLCGAVAYLDISGNESDTPSLDYPRFNIAVFRTIPDSEWRIVVEAHQDMRQNT